MTTETNSTAKAQEAMSDINAEAGDLGALLQSYKKEADLSITQISEALCLPPSAVQMLENEEFDHLPEPPYVRGYLRNYARLADKDPTHAIAIYDSLRGVSSEDTALHFAPVGSISSSNKSGKVGGILKWLFLLLLLALLAFLIMNQSSRDWFTTTWQSFSNDDNSGQQQEVTDFSLTPSLTGEIPGNLPPIQVDEGPADTETAATQTDASNNVGVTTSPVASEATEGVATLNQAMAAQSEDAANNTDALPETIEPTAAGDAADANSSDGSIDGIGTKVRLVFTKEVWMRIRNKDDKSVFEQVNKAGTEQELVLEKPLKFRVGNAQGLELYVDGEKMDITPFIKGSIAGFGLE